MKFVFPEKWFRRNSKERPWRDVPGSILLFAVTVVAVQVFVHTQLAPPASTVRALPPTPSFSQLRLTSFGEPTAAAKLRMLWLQAFDNQPGISIPFRALDYQRLRDWLAAILRLDPRSDYPLLSAARLYAEFAEPEQQRIMLNFVRDAFIEAPAQRWQWLAHAVFIAKHRLDDLPLALEFAQLLADKTTPDTAPSWARQMHIFLQEDMGETEAAKVLLGGLLASGEVTDPGEYAFLKERLDALESGAH